MKLYRPVLIESAEQAEALPEGTVAFSQFDFVRERCHGGWTGGDGDALYSHADMTGYDALVPVEAEEEFQDIGAYEASGHMRRHHLTRYTTPWEAAS